MNAIKVGNIMLMKDKVINIRLTGRTIIVGLTIGETHIGYDSQEDAQKAFDMFYNEFNKK